MKRLLLSFLFIFFCASSQAASIPDKISTFRQELFKEKTEAVYNIAVLHQLYPAPLLLPSTLLPQSSHYPQKPLLRLYYSATHCQKPWPQDPALSTPVHFSQALCQGKVLSPSWFEHSGFIHPGGGSYAYRYLEIHPDQYDQLEQFLHIQERPLANVDTLLGRLQRMDNSEIQALIHNAMTFISGDTLWVRNDQNYDLFDASVWKPLLAQNHLTFSLRHKDQVCLAQSGNLCWQSQDISHLSRNAMIFLIVINMGLLIGWLLYRWRIRRRAMQERMLVLQILTHELRTPIASLSMTVEGFRRHFDALPESLYDEFRRLTEDSRRLRQLAEASKDYLQAEHAPLKVQKIESFNEWITYICEPYHVTLELGEDRCAYLNMYWLGTCIDNLLSNAQKYGVQPITLSVTFTDKKLLLTVADKGKLTAKDWGRLRKPFVSHGGLGLGLTIVESMVHRMQGKLTLQGPPTTFILEIPCESNAATG